VINQLDSQVLLIKIHGHKTLIDRKASMVVRVEIAHLNLAYDQGIDSDIHSPLEVQKSSCKIGGVTTFR
jgi:hypothetical protein